MIQVVFHRAFSIAAIGKGVALLLVLAGMVTCGCSSRSGSEGGNEVLRVAVIPKGTQHDFWNNVQAGADAADEELADLKVSWKGPLSEGQTRVQIETVENFLADEYDGICLAPLDANALRAPVERALKKEIPVLVFDSGLADNEGILSYVASDNYRGGQLAGEYLAELLEGEGKIILMRYQINSESTEAREQGFVDAIKEFPHIEFLSDDQYGGTDEAKAIEVGGSLLQEFGDQVDGIFCPNESTTSGMLTVLRRRLPNRLGEVKFVGFDAGENLIDGLEKGHLHGTVLQDPVQMGYLSVKTMHDHLMGKPTEERLPTRLHVAKSSDLEDPVTLELLRPLTNHRLLNAESDE